MQLDEAIFTSQYVPGWTSKSIHILEDCFGKKHLATTEELCVIWYRKRFGREICETFDFEGRSKLQESLISELDNHDQPAH